MNARALEGGLLAIKADNRFLHFVVALLAAVVLILSLALVMRSERVIVVPAGATERMTIERSKADRSTLAQWGLYVAVLLGNVSPTNAEQLGGALETMTTSSAYQPLMKAIASQAADIKADGLSVSFQYDRFDVDTEAQKVWVTGSAETRNARGQTERSTRTYEITFKVIGYRPMVDGISVYEGVPRR